MRKAVYDTETDGFLARMTRLHCLVIKDVSNVDVDARTVHVFRRRDAGEYTFYRRNDDMSFFLTNPEDPNSRVRDTAYFEAEDTIADGVRMLEQFDIRIAHNGQDFDERAIAKIYPDYAPNGRIMDTLVLARVVVPDTKNLDWSLHKKGKFPGYLIGKHSLDAWGWRLGRHKGDYMNDCAKLGIDPWLAWNPDMENYCVNDVLVNEILWAALEKDLPPDTCDKLEHEVNDLASVVRGSGVPFAKAEAEKLLDELDAEAEKLTEKLKATYGGWFMPASKKVVGMLWDDPDGVNKKKVYEPRDMLWGEDDPEQLVYGKMKFPKKTRRRAERIAAWQAQNDKLAARGKDPLPLPSTIDLPDITEGCPYVEMKYVEFNPGSRPQIIDRFVTCHGWEPVDFTEKGNPEVNDAVLLALKEKIPEAAPLSELFFYNKLRGQIATGKESWINNCAEDGRIHGYINTNGAVTGRCTHAAPNMSQVPSVMKRGKTILMGREGEYGWECRSLFYAPEGWQTVGADLANIEARAFAAVLAEFDGGKLAAELAAGLDLHDLNMAATGIDDRGIMKRVFFGLLYGAGDPKLGYTAKPLASPREARELGAYYRSLIINKIPGFKQADDKIKKQAARGYLLGLDGRRLHCRSPHSALNLRLQSDAALIAKKWWVLTEAAALDAGMNHGWDKGDFAMWGFFHDEQQAGVREQYAEFFADLAVKAAPVAGEYFNFGCVVKAEAKIGKTWAHTH